MPDYDLGPQVLSRVRDAADMVDVVGEQVRLRRQGRRWVGLCPFHEEKTPSFSIDPERGLYYCFGCRAGGDIIDFVMRSERLEFPEAVERLARRFGVELPPRSPQARRQQQAAERQRKVLEEAQSWFAQQLSTPPAQEARRILERRGYGRETWTDFGFGFAPDSWRSLLEHLSRRHQEGTVVEAGLAVAGEGGGRPYDRFRGRITFPIRSADGRLQAFGGRALGDAQPKYLNSPEGPLFHKRSTLFCLDRARRPISESGYAVVVEGYFDCLSLHRAGVAEAVATLGTSLTPEHGRMLRRLSSRVLLCYDADEAGRRAAGAGARVVLETGVEAAVVVVPSGMDPDDVVREQGADAFRAMLESPTPLLDFLLAELPPDPAGRRAAAGKVAELVGVASDPVIRFSLLEELARRLDLRFDVVEEMARRGAARGRAPKLDRTAPQAPASLPGERILARILLECPPERYREALEGIEPDYCQDPRVRRLLVMARELQAQGDDPDRTLSEVLEGGERDAELLGLMAEVDAADLPALEELDVERQLRVVTTHHARRRAREMTGPIAELERSIGELHKRVESASGDDPGAAARQEEELARLEGKLEELQTEKVAIRRKSTEI